MTGEAMRIRVQMTAEGWQSDDRLTKLGWGGEIYGYHVWFNRWDWHGKRVDYLQATYHASTSDLTKIDETVQRAAERARRALHDFPDRPPSQGMKGELISSRIPLTDQS